MIKDRYHFDNYILSKVDKKYKYKPEAIQTTEQERLEAKKDAMKKKPKYVKKVQPKKKPIVIKI